MQSQNYSLTATATTATSPNSSPPSNALADMPWLSDSGATYSSTNNLSDLHRPAPLLTPIPITGADGTIIYATHVGSAHFDTSHAVYFVPRSAVKLVSLGALTASGYSVRTDRDRSFVITRPTGTCPIRYLPHPIQQHLDLPKSPHDRQNPSHNRRSHQNFCYIWRYRTPVQYPP